MTTFVFKQYPKVQMDNGAKNRLTVRMVNEAVNRKVDIKVSKHGLKNGGLIVTNSQEPLRDDEVHHLAEHRRECSRSTEKRWKDEKVTR